MNKSRALTRQVTPLQTKLEAVWAVYEAIKHLPHNDRREVIQLAQSQVNREAGQTVCNGGD